MTYLTPQELLRAAFPTAEKRNAEHMQFLRSAKHESERLHRETGKAGLDDDDFATEEDRLAFLMRRG